MTGTVVLTICTGNLFRSPAAEYLLRAALGTDVHVMSGGITPNVGGPVGRSMAHLLEAEGLDVSDFRSRYVSEDDVRGATLVLGLAREHRSHAVALWPAAVKRAYTLKEFARLASRVTAEELQAAAAGDSDSERLAALATLAGRKRTPATPEEDDVPDPASGIPGTTELAFAQIREAVETITRAVRGN